MSEPVLTPVTGRARRPLSYSTFADLVPDARLLSITRDGDTTTLTFDAELTPEQRQQVWARLTSTDDVDQVDRELTTALMEDVKAMPESPLTRLVVRLARRRLMDQTNP